MADFISESEFVDLLHKDSASVTEGTDLANSELIGIWKERDDIEDNRDFARRLRTEAEHRGH